MTWLKRWAWFALDITIHFALCTAALAICEGEAHFRRRPQ